MTTTADALLDRIAEMARSTYINERRSFEARRTGMESYYGQKGLGRWDGTEEPGKRDRFGRNCKPVWPEIARFAARNGADVAGLIRARFAYHTGRNPPEPPDCKTELALTFLRQRESTQGPQLLLRLEGERAQTRVELLVRSRYIERFGWTPEQVVLSVIDDPTLDLSPLFRVILAGEHKLPHLVEAYFPLAVQQYQSARLYYENSPWAALIPASVRVEADRLTQYATRSVPR